MMAGCGVLHRPAAQTGSMAAVTPFPSYSGPKASIAVMGLEIKAAKASEAVGSGLHEMLTSALTQSNRFLIAEYQALSTTALERAEQPIPASNQEESNAQKGKVKGADLIVTAAVTEFEPQASGGSAGVGGGGGASTGMMGGLLGTALNKAHVVLDIRIMDVSSSKVLAATRVQGQASDVAGGLTKEFSGSLGLSKGLSNYTNTPMEKAVRICIIEAVRYISQAVPGDYYKY